MSEEEKKMIEFLKGAYKLVDKGKVELQKEDIANILHLIEKQQEETKELKERLSVRKEQQETILVEKIKILREEKIELIHDIEEREKILKKEIKSLLKEIEELKELVHEKTEILDVGDAVITFNKTIGNHENCISKDKVMLKLTDILKNEFNNTKDEIETSFVSGKIHILKELLEE